ncbi:NAD(P)/FAD-dependent oxidoreductase [Roseovarius arcticus]|uniref:NAD(P)/FAD-dependent oxidoreductase n=1 Tax=Roseovarius arcticus TaxID=2547404 RepID=UPI001486CD61|nr:FAD-dependent oxidoreductase [Roseovarius arcticus]
MTPLPKSAEVVVVGGGVIGASISLALAEAGAKPVLLEARAFGGAVTGGSLAAIGTHMHGREEFGILDYARDRWRELSDASQDGIEYTACGKMGFILTDAALAAGKTLVAQEKSQGARAELLMPEQAQQYERLLGGPILAMTYDPDTATVNPFHAVRALMLAARQAGAQLFENTPVARLLVEAGRVVGVETSTGERVSTPHAVLACGPWTTKLAADLDLNLPIEPRQAQCLASIRQPSGTLRQVISSCEAKGGVDSGYTQIQQSPSGQILFNTVTALAPTPKGAEDRVGEVQPGFVVDSVNTLLMLFPALKDLPILRSWVRFEAVTPDARFLAGPVPVPGLHVCAGDNGSGFCRAPLLAQFIADGVTGRQTLPVALQQRAAQLYDPLRFMDGQNV